MKTKQFIIIAALLLAAIAPLRAQDFEKLNDTTWRRNAVTWPDKDEVVQYASPVDLNSLIVDNNNDTRTAGLCFAGAIGCATIATGLVYVNYGGKRPLNASFIDVAAVAFGLGSFGLEVAGSVKLIRDRVYLTPEGVVVKISQTDKKPR